MWGLLIGTFVRSSDCIWGRLIGTFVRSSDCIWGRLTKGTFTVVQLWAVECWILEFGLQKLWPVL